MNFLEQFLSLLNAKTIRSLVMIFQAVFQAVDELQLDARDFPQQAIITGSLVNFILHHIMISCHSSLFKVIQMNKIEESV